MIWVVIERTMDAEKLGGGHRRVLRVLLAALLSIIHATFNNSPGSKMDAQQPPPSSSGENSLFLKLVYWHKLFESDSPPRLGIDVDKRIRYATMSALSTGSALGYYYGSKKAGLVFRAENAHRFPTTSTGWFQYHKTKNYISVVGGVKEGAKLGLKLGTGALVFSLFEETVDYARHDERDFLSTVTAGLSFSGIYSLLGKTSGILRPCVTQTLTFSLSSSP